MHVPDDRRYTEEHEWVLVTAEGNVRIGITDYAQDALGDIVYVELPAVGRNVNGGEAIAEVESTKSVADVYAPVSGTVSAVNESLSEQPELINNDPYDAGWFVELDTGGPPSLDDLLDAAAYRDLIA